MYSPITSGQFSVLAGLGLLLSAAAAPPSSAQAQDAAVDIKVVKFSGVEEAVKQNKGKVVVVDFWADYCVPCKKGFPHLVALHTKYAKDGVAVIAVNLDDPTDAAAREKAVKFLKDQKAAFTNLFIDPSEKPEDWFTRLRIESIPAMFVFNREGKLEKRYVDDVIKHDEVEKLVTQLLSRK
jgi:thiol-disulfide isomerase/thioredoxin